MTHTRFVALFFILSLAIPSYGITDTVEESTPDPLPPTIEQSTEYKEAEKRALSLGEIILRIDENARQQNNVWSFVIEAVDVTLVYDVSADRMRVMTPIAQVAELDGERLHRLMQANFDSALDSRYAVAHQVLWGVFIHRLSTLSDEDFLSGIGQTVNIKLTYGTSYSSGELVFGSGDSGELLRKKLIEELKKKGQTI